MLRLKTNGIYVKKCYHILFKQCIPSAALPAPWHPVCFSSTGLDGDICAWFVTCHSRLQEQVLHLELRNVSNALVKSWKKPPTLALLCVWQDVPLLTILQFYGKDPRVCVNNFPMACDSARMFCSINAGHAVI